jgi:hypothetical protein
MSNAVGLTSQSHLSQQQYAFQDPAYGATSESVKTRLINLIGAVRTLMRSARSLCSSQRPLNIGAVPLIAINIAVIGYELVLG